MWLNRISADISVIPEFIDHYTSEYNQARSECKIIGVIETNLAMLPGITEHRFAQLQEIEAVLKFIEIKVDSAHQKATKKFYEHYNRELNFKEAEKYAGADDEVVTLKLIKNEIAYIRNQMASIVKGLESKNFMLGHIVRLRAAGLEDIQLS